jgi:hypothetical protein
MGEKEMKQINYTYEELENKYPDTKYRVQLFESFYRDLIEELKDENEVAVSPDIASIMCLAKTQKLETQLDKHLFILEETGTKVFVDVELAR